MNWKRITANVTGTAGAGVALAAIIAGVDWITALGIVFACAANLIGLFQKSPIKKPEPWNLR